MALQPVLTSLVAGMFARCALIALAQMLNPYGLAIALETA